MEQTDSGLEQESERMREQYIEVALDCIEDEAKDAWRGLEATARVHNIELDWTVRQFINAMERLYAKRIKKGIE